MIAVRGDIDLAVLTRLPRWLHTVFEPPGSHFCLDLTAVSFLDCAGLRALLAIEDRVVTAGGSIEATGMSAAVVRLLELLNLPAGSTFLAIPAATFATVTPAASMAYELLPRADETFSRRPLWSSTMTEPELAAACDAAVAQLVEQLVAGLVGNAAGAGTEMLRLHVLALVRDAADRQVVQAISRANLLLSSTDVRVDAE
ncbi:hypothetical protein GCM10009839_51870 [Catenulispora yoronensis]|uniref:STAS domain-containing protein n=1 Tax=Catenulispora yoronensis TaxID=450799 RepID=A0ABP5GCW7_9ACTN